MATTFPTHAAPLKVSVQKPRTKKEVTSLDALPTLHNQKQDQIKAFAPDASNKGQAKI